MIYLAAHAHHIPHNVADVLGWAGVVAITAAIVLVLRRG